MGIVEERCCDGGVVVLRLNRPDRMNALGMEMIEALRAALARHALAEATCAIVVTGTDLAFCSGADLVSFLSSAQADPASVGRQVAQAMDVAFNPLMQDAMNFPKPLVTAVNGMAAGGGAALALCADVVLAGRSAKLKFVQVQQLGCVADLGANWLMQRIAGRGTALAAVLLGQTIGAERAYQLGLFWEVVEDEILEAHAIEIATLLARVPREAVIASRRLVDLGASATFGAVMEMERLYQHELAGRPDLAEVVQAFLATRASAGKTNQ